MYTRFSIHNSAKCLAHRYVKPIDKALPGPVLGFFVALTDLLQKLADRITMKRRCLLGTSARQPLTGLIDHDLNPEFCQ